MNPVMNSQTGRQTHENLDLLADFAGEDLEGMDEEASKEREDILKQKYDEFFTSESDEIEEDLVDGESSDSDSESGHNLQPNSFEEMVKAQEKSYNSKSGKDLPEHEQSPQTSTPDYTEMTGSERRNKYKRDKKSASGGIKSSAFGENNTEEPFEFDPPEQTHQVVSQNFDDFFSSGQASVNQVMPSDRKAGVVFGFGKLGNEFDIIPKSGASQASQMGGSFYSTWDEDEDDDLFATPSGQAQPDGDGIDEEDRRFFEELSKGFYAKEREDLGPMTEPLERNSMMDNTRATRQMLQAHRDSQQNEVGQDLDMGFGAEREESKEDEYDYFLDNQPDENDGNAPGYHIIDEKDLQESDEDLEELDEEEKLQRHHNMLKEFKERIERDESRVSRSPRYRPND